MYRFYFQDTLEPVTWWDNPSHKAGPWETFREAVSALVSSGMVYNGPADACYILMTEDQRASLLDRMKVPEVM